MKHLYINTCSKDIIIKYFKNVKVIREEIISGQRNNSQFIMPSIKKVLENEVPDTIIVVIGPGSFTGIRLGVTIAKTFAYVKNIPIRTITTLEETAVSIRGNFRKVAIKENNGYFYAEFDKNINLINDFLYYQNSEFDEIFKDQKVYLNPKINYKKVISYTLKKECVNPHTIKPVYVKVIEALK